MNHGEQAKTAVWSSRAGTAIRRASGPWGSLRRRVTLWAVVLVALPTVMCAVWLNQITERSMSRSHVQTVRLLGQTLSGALAGRIDRGWSNSSQAVIDAAVGDPRVVLVVVTDEHGQLLHRRVTDPHTYQTMLQSGLARANMDLDVGRPRRFGDHGELVVQKTPIWNRGDRTMHGRATAKIALGQGGQSRSALGQAFGAMTGPWSARQPSSAQRSEKRALEGYVLLGVYDRSLPTMLSQLQRTQLTAAGLVCLAAVPLLIWLAHRWTRPVRAMLGATTDLAEGRPTQPVPAHDRDELGMLGHAFNQMANRLIDARHQLEEHNQDLEHEVQQRTAELARTNQALAEQIKDKDSLLRAVSHDLGAPLRNIDGMASMVLRKYREQLADDAVVKLERISSNVKSQTQLIGELVRGSRHAPVNPAGPTRGLSTCPGQSPSKATAHFSKAQSSSPATDSRVSKHHDSANTMQTQAVLAGGSLSGTEQAIQSPEAVSSAAASSEVRANAQPQGPTEAVNIRHVVEQIGEALSYELETGYIELRIEGDFPSLPIDPIRIRQVFQNLIDNAAKYMRDRPVRRITVGAQPAQGEGVHVFHVSDTGGGIAVEDMPGLFDPYQRGGQWVDSEVEGAGVGLASIKAIIEGYGGRIWARSQPGHGSTFTFTLATERG